MKKLILVLFLLTFEIISAQNVLHINGREYIRENNQWFIKDLKTDNLFPLNELSMTVKLKEGKPRQALDALNHAHGIEITTENILGFIDLKLPEGSVFHQKLNAYLNSGLFEYVEINSYGRLLSEDAIPDDPFFSDQYYLHNDNGWPHINAPAAWNIETGASNTVTVAVLDLGVWMTNVDLNLSGIYYDYINGGAPIPDPVNDRHGTGVAGIIGAKTNNGLMVSGIAGGWGNNYIGSKIMAVRVGYGDFIDGDKVDDAIIFAADNGAKIINMSFWIDETQAVKNAIEYAFNQKGCLIVASAGNQRNHTILRFPARHPKVHSVGGINKLWQDQGTSGPDLDVVSPSVNIVSTDNSEYGVYISYHGTSFASPQVAGVGALLFSKNPNLLHMDIRKVINQTAIITPQMTDPTKFGNGLLQADKALYAIFQANGIIPDYPTQLTLTNNNPVTLRWRTVQPTLENSIVSHYNVYRSKSPNRYNFVKVGELLHDNENVFSIWVEQTQQIGTFYYRVSTVDDNDRESITSNEVSVSIGIGEKAGFGEESVFEYSLEHNYPNPFNPSTNIEYTIKEAGWVKLVIYDILGQEVRTLVNEFQNAGKHSARFDARSIPSGVYLYKLQSGSYSKTLKMILTK